MEHATRRKTDTPIFTAVKTGRRRLLLSILIDRGEAMSERELATELGAAERDVPMADLSTAERRDIWLDLRHVHLPLLADSGLVIWRSGEESVTTADRAAFTDPRFRRVLSLDGEDVDGVFACLSNSRRRRVLAILKDRRAPISPIALAREITRKEYDEPTRAAFDEVTQSLLHTHLPKLEDADLVEYDDEADRVVYVASPTLERLATILREPNSSLLERVDGFLEGLRVSYGQSSENTGTPFNWPASWRESDHG